MTLLEKIKPRLGIFYSDPNKDEEIQQMIDGAVSYFSGAGWNINIDPAPSPLAVEAIALYCKMAMNTDAAQLTNHPVLLSFIVQGRAVTGDAET